MAEETTKKTVKKTTTAKTVKKEAAKAPKAPAVKKAVKEAPVKAEASVSTAKKAEKKYAAVSVDVVNLDGKVTGKISLPGELFGEKVNKALLAQAVRVYLANQRQGTVSTKTRGEVDGSTRKIYRQKGTGRARHGSLRAPIFVKGGVVFGPKPRDYSLSFPQKMKRKALASALSAKVKDKELVVIEGLSEIKPKTKVFVTMMKNIKVTDAKTNVLFVTSVKVEPVIRAGRNVPGVQFIPATLLNTYAVLTAKNIVVMKDAVEEMKQHFARKDK